MKKRSTTLITGKCKSKPNEIQPHFSEWLSSKRQQIISVDKHAEKRKPSCHVGGNVNWYSHKGKQYEDSLKKRKKKREREREKEIWSNYSPGYFSEE